MLYIVEGQFPLVNIFFDVDHTLIDSDNRLRPGVRELFERLTADGHSLYIWSGIGARPEVLVTNQLHDLVSGCFIKPLYQYRRMLAPLGIVVQPDYVVDDHPHLVAEFGGLVVSRFARYDVDDREMQRVYETISALPR